MSKRPFAQDHPNRQPEPPEISTSAKDRSLSVFGLIAPCLLATVALIQMAIASQTPLTPWKGGGFGMFSDIQQPGNRSVLAFVNIDEKLSPVQIPLWMDRQKMIVQAMPTEANLRTLVKLLSELDWDEVKLKSASDAAEKSDVSEIAKRDIVIGLAFEVRYRSDQGSGKRSIYLHELCRATETIKSFGSEDVR